MEKQRMQSYLPHSVSFHYFIFDGHCWNTVLPFYVKAIYKYPQYVNLYGSINVDELNSKLIILIWKSIIKKKLVLVAWISHRDCKSQMTLHKFLLSALRVLGCHILWLKNFSSWFWGSSLLMVPGSLQLCLRPCSAGTQRRPSASRVCTVSWSPSFWSYTLTCNVFY